MEKFEIPNLNNIDRKQALKMLEFIEKVGEQNAIVCENYLAAIDFLEKKELKKEFEKFLTARKRFN